MRRLTMTARASGLAIVGVALLMLAACHQSSPAAAAPTEIIIGTVYPNQSWDLVGRALAEAYTRTLPGVHATTLATNNLEEHVDGLAAGRIHLAIEDAETAYIAYGAGTRSQPAPHRTLRAISVLFSTAVQVIARNGSSIDHIADLKGHRVVTGGDGGPTQRAARLILDSHGVKWDAVEHVSARGGAEAMRAGELDAMFIYSPFGNPIITELLADGSAHLVPLDARNIAAIQEGHHFLKSTTIPRGTYKGEDGDVLAVGMDVLLLCRADLPDPLVYDLARELFSSVPQLARAHAAASGINPDRGPTASIPLHPGAARFYREREILK